MSDAETRPPTTALEGFRERKLDVTMTVQDLSDVAKSLGALSIHKRISHDLVKKLEEDRGFRRVGAPLEDSAFDQFAKAIR